jgi:magnesium-transporting ATPase (P-type)
MNLVAAATSAAPTPLIAWHTLWQILWISMATGLVIVALMSIGIQALSLSHRGGSAFAKAAYSTLMVICGLAVLALIGWGFYLIIHKS